MKIEEVKYQDGILALKIKRCPEVLKFMYEFKTGDYEISKKKEKRSLDCNAYCWALCTEIGIVTTLPKETVYKRAVRDYGVSELISVQKGREEAFNRVWSGRGLGWWTEVWDSYGETTRLMIYYGSSCYNKHDMKNLLDGLVMEAKTLGIETLSERELSLLKENWNG